MWGARRVNSLCEGVPPPQQQQQLAKNQGGEGGTPPAAAVEKTWRGGCTPLRSSSTFRRGGMGEYYSSPQQFGWGCARGVDPPSAAAAEGGRSPPPQQQQLAKHAGGGVHPKQQQLHLGGVYPPRAWAPHM